MYDFKVASKHEDKRRRGAWRHISIEGEKTLWHLDQALREAFGHELDDHLSQFTLYGYNYLVSPERKVDAGPLELKGFVFFPGQRIEWIWDLGDCWEHIIVYIGKGE